MKKINVKKMATIALLMALVIVMQFVSSMIPSFGGFNFSLVLIPIVLGAAMYGPATGALLGATFGTIVFINCVTGADVGGAMVLQANPIICFLVVMGKGVLAGIASGWVYKLLKAKNSYLAIVLAAIVCPVVNTGIFVTFMLTVFVDVLSQWSAGGDVIAYAFSAIILVNFVPELILNIVVSPASNRLIKVFKKQ